MQRPRPGTLPALVAGVIALIVGIYYVALIDSQGGRTGHCSLCEPGVWWIAGMMFGGGILASASAVIPSGRTYALGAAAGMLTFIALIVLVSSIAFIAGPPMLLAAVLTSFAMAWAARLERIRKATAFAVALLLLLLGVGSEFATIALR